MQWALQGLVGSGGAGLGLIGLSLAPYADLIVRQAAAGQQHVGALGGGDVRRAELSAVDRAAACGGYAEHTAV